MKLEVIKAGIIQAIADADLPLSELEVHVEMAKGHIVARLTERCAHGAVEETVEHETEWECIDEGFQRSETVGVRPLGKLEVFLWLLPKWLRWRKPRFERVTRQTHVTNAYRKDVTLKKVTYLPRPDLSTRRDYKVMGNRMTSGMSMDHYLDFMTASILEQQRQEDLGTQYVPSPLAGLPVHVSKHVPDDQVMIVSPKTFSLLRKQLP